MWYTGRGDEGSTSLFGGERVEKDAPRIEALGDLDEANASLGMARSMAVRDATGPVLLRIQRELSLLMAEVATPNTTPCITATMVETLEADIVAVQAEVIPPREFIVPGDSRGGAALHLARAVVRRAERRVVHLVREGLLTNSQLIRYLNRLSSLLFLFALADDRSTGIHMTTRVK